MSAAKRHMIKCASNVWIVRLAALRLWKCGCTNWYLILFLSKPCLRMDDASLSIMCIFGWFSLVVNMDGIEIATSRNSAALRVLVGIAWILLL